MIIGVPKEIKNNEFRVGLSPESVRSLITEGHEVLIETNAGLGSGFSNEDYYDSGAKIVQTPEEIFQVSELIVKVKEPQSAETKKLRPDQILFTYLHLASSRELTIQLLKSKCISIAYETINTRDSKASCKS